jgi:hypothetical protein
MTRAARQVLRAAIVILASTACGASPPPAAPAVRAGPASPGDETLPAETPVEEVAVRFGRAAIAGDRAAARALALTHAQLAGYLAEPPDEATYQAELERFLTGAAREASEATDPKVVGAKMVETATIPANPDVTRDVEYAAVKLVVEQDGRTHESFVPFLFIRTDVGWRFSPKK